MGKRWVRFTHLALARVSKNRNHFPLFKCPAIAFDSSTIDQKALSVNVPRKSGSALQLNRNSCFYFARNFFLFFRLSRLDRLSRFVHGDEVVQCTLQIIDKVFKTILGRLDTFCEKGRFRGGCFLLRLDPISFSFRVAEMNIRNNKRLMQMELQLCDQLIVSRMAPHDIGTCFLAREHTKY